MNAADTEAIVRQGGATESEILSGPLNSALFTHSGPSHTLDLYLQLLYVCLESLRGNCCVRFSSWHNRLHTGLLGHYFYIQRIA